MPERGEVGVVNEAVINVLDIILPLKGLSFDKVFPDMFLHLLLGPPAVPAGEGGKVSYYQPGGQELSSDLTVIV